MRFDDASFDAAVSIWTHTDGGRAIGPDGLRARVAATHLTLGLFLQTFLDAGFQIDVFEELGDREYPVPGGPGLPQVRTHARRRTNLTSRRRIGP